MLLLNGTFTNIYFDKNNRKLCLIMIGGEISIASYNCNGLADNKKRQSVFTWLKEKEYNIYCLQETHSTVLDEVLCKKNWGRNILLPLAKKFKRGDGFN